MTLAKFIVIITIALTTIAVALIVGAVILMEKEQGTQQEKMQCGGAVKHKPVRESEWVFPLTRSKVIFWVPIDEEKPGADHVLVTLQHASDDLEVCEMDYWAETDEWRDKVVAWAKLPEPYKK